MYIRKPFPEDAEGKRAALKKCLDEAPDWEVEDIFDLCLPRLLPPPPKREGEPEYGTKEFYDLMDKEAQEIEDGTVETFSWEEVHAELLQSLSRNPNTRALPTDTAKRSAA